MITIKHKFFAFCLLVVMFVSAFSVLVPGKSYANHDICYDGTGSVRFIEECARSEREKNNVACFENNSGDNDAIAECVNKSSEHHNATGSKEAAENAPPLPSDALPQGPGNPEGDCKAGADGKIDQSNCGIIYYTVLLTRTLSALVGIVIVVMMVVGGIQYAASRDDPSQVAGAKNHIQNTVMALIFYIFALAFLQWLVPGGVF